MCGLLIRVSSAHSGVLPKQMSIYKVGRNRIHTPYLTVYLMEYRMYTVYIYIYIYIYINGSGQPYISDLSLSTKCES